MVGAAVGHAGAGGTARAGGARRRLDAPRGEVRLAHLLRQVANARDELLVGGRGGHRQRVAELLQGAGVVARAHARLGGVVERRGVRPRAEGALEGDHRLGVAVALKRLHASAIEAAGGLHLLGVLVRLRARGASEEAEGEGGGTGGVAVEHGADVRPAAVEASSAMRARVIGSGRVQKGVSVTMPGRPRRGRGVRAGRGLAAGTVSTRCGAVAAAVGSGRCREARCVRGAGAGAGSAVGARAGSGVGAGSGAAAAAATTGARAPRGRHRPPGPPAADASVDAAPLRHPHRPRRPGSGAA